MLQPASKLIEKCFICQTLNYLLKVIQPTAFASRQQHNEMDFDGLEPD